MEAGPAAHAQEGGGDRLYHEHCAACHGATGRGDGPNAALFSITPRDLHDGVLSRYGTDDLVRRVRDGRALELALDRPALRAHAQDVDDVVAHMKRLPTLDWGVVDEGWGIYTQRCERCHGRFGRPPASFPTGVRPPRPLGDPAFQRSTDDAALREAIRHGRKGMPAPSPRPAADEVALLVAFIRTLSPGFETYSQYCAACHGDSGRGAPAIDPALPNVVFDASYFNRTHPEHLHQAVWHMMRENQPSMPHFRRALTESETQRIIEYLRSNAPSPNAVSPPRAHTSP
jgi:mono/diheme cytochrome c family protein